ncbi:membrane protein [Streptococcus uberis]|nr:membrane protein [Streptococcus uberis]
MNPQPSNKKTIAPLLFQKHSDADLKHFKLSAIFSFIPAYFYIVNVFQKSNFYLVLSYLLIIILVEINQPIHNLRQHFRQKTPEENLLLGALLVQLLAIGLWGFPEELIVLQFFTLHLTLLYYILSRNHSFIQGRFGSLVLLDAWHGFWTIPMKHFRYRSKILKNQLPNLQKRISGTPLLVVTALGSIFVALSLVFFAISQLQEVSTTFKQVTNGWASLFETFFSQIYWFDSFVDSFIYLIFSIPLGAYLYGLIVGPLISKSRSVITFQTVQEKLNQNRILPLFSSYLIIGSLCLIYSLFLMISFLDLQSLFQVQHISPQNASHTAVSGFWQLVRVALLNFVTLVASYFFSRIPIWNTKFGKSMLTILFSYTLVFALIASWKLFGIYILLYGLTPLRLISGWFITVLIFWTVLTITRLHKPFQAIRYGLFYSIISFSCLPYLFALLLY